MTTTETRTYEFLVDGHLDDHWSAWLDGLTLARHDDGTTTLAGPMADQAQLHGLLARLRDMGTTLVSMRALRDGVPMDGVPVNQAPQTPGHPLLGLPVRTRRLTLRAGTAEDAEATFAYRRLEQVGQWLTQLPTDLETYRAAFTDPARLAACCASASRISASTASSPAASSTTAPRGV